MANLISKDTFSQSETQARYRPTNVAKSVYTRGGWVTGTSDGVNGLREAQKAAHDGLKASLFGVFPLDEILVTKVSNTLYRVRGVYRFRSAPGQGTRVPYVKGPTLRTGISNTRWYEQSLKVLPQTTKTVQAMKALKLFKNATGEAINETYGPGDEKYPSGDLDTGDDKNSTPRPRHYQLPVSVTSFSYPAQLTESPFGKHHKMINKTNLEDILLLGQKFHKNTVLFEGMEVDQIDFSTRSQFVVSYKLLIRENGWVKQELYQIGAQPNNKWEARVVPMYERTKFDFRL